MANGQSAENFTFILLITLVATIGGFLFGFDSGVINGTVEGLKQSFQSDDIATGFNVASMLLGCAVGAFFAGRLADLFGRRTLLIASAIFFLISAWGSGYADSSFSFIIYRIIGGIAVGAASVMAPAYISEIAPARYRGSLATIQQIAIIVGLFSAFVSNYFLASIAESATNPIWMNLEAWRWMFWVEIIPSALFFTLLFFIPESPRFLVLSGKFDTAKQTLVKLYGEEEATNKIRDIERSLSSDHKPALSDLLEPTSKKVKPIVWIGIGLATFQQLVGINVVFYYGAVLWQAVGFSESDALLINILSAGLSIFACTITILLIDKIGRKPFLLIGSIGMAVSLISLVIAFQSGEFSVDGKLSLSDSMGTLALISANVYVFFFNLSWGPVMWVMLGEMFPNQIRGSGLAISGLAQWGSNFGITMTFPILLASIGLVGAYSIYAGFAVLSIFFVAKYVYETKGKELEEM
jgi:sugar porter (SP) family MFS transporter